MTSFLSTDWACRHGRASGHELQAVSIEVRTPLRKPRPGTFGEGADIRLAQCPPRALPLLCHAGGGGPAARLHGRSGSPLVWPRHVSDLHELASLGGATMADARVQILHGVCLSHISDVMLSGHGEQDRVPSDGAEYWQRSKAARLGARSVDGTEQIEAVWRRIG